MKPLHTLTLLAALFALPAISTASEDPTLNTILQKHLEAMGGLNNWSQVESIRMSGTVERNGQVVDIVIVKKRPDQIRATVTIPHPSDPDLAVQLIRAHDGKTAWTATRAAGAPKITQTILTGDAASELLESAGVLPPLIKEWRTGAEIKLLGTHRSGNQSAFVIESSLESGRTHTYYLSTETYLTTQRESENNAARLVSYLEDYKAAHGITIPMKTRLQNSTAGESIITFDSIELGVGIYDEYFEANDSGQTAKH